MYQRIEQLIGKKLDRYNAEEAEVLVFLERVTEAQRIAALELRESGVNGKKVKAFEQDTEEVEDAIATHKRKAGKTFSGGNRGGKNKSNPKAKRGKKF